MGVRSVKVKRFLRVHWVLLIYEAKHRLDFDLSRGFVGWFLVKPLLRGRGRIFTVQCLLLDSRHRLLLLHFDASSAMVLFDRALVHEIDLLLGHCLVIEGCVGVCGPERCLGQLQVSREHTVRLGPESALKLSLWARFHPWGRFLLSLGHRSLTGFHREIWLGLKNRWAWVPRKRSLWKLPFRCLIFRGFDNWWQTEIRPIKLVVLKLLQNLGLCHTRMLEHSPVIVLTFQRSCRFNPCSCVDDSLRHFEIILIDRLRIFLFLHVVQTSLHLAKLVNCWVTPRDWFHSAFIFLSKVIDLESDLHYGSLAICKRIPRLPSKCIC